MQRALWFNPQHHREASFVLTTIKRDDYPTNDLLSSVQRTTAVGKLEPIFRRRTALATQLPACGSLRMSFSAEVWAVVGR